MTVSLEEVNVMAVSPFLGRDGLFHTFTFITLHTARIYDVPSPPDKHALGLRAIIAAPYHVTRRRPR